MLQNVFKTQFTSRFQALTFGFAMSVEYSAICLVGLSACALKPDGNDLMNIFMEKYFSLTRFYEIIRDWLNI